MTTHFVEIRPSFARRREARVSDLHDLSTWEVLTVAAVSLTDAENLCKAIGPHWDSRIVASAEVDGGELARLTLFGIVEELPEGSVQRWKKVEVVHHPDCKAVNVEWTMIASATTTATQWLTLQTLSKNITKARKRAAEIGINAAGYDDEESAFNRTIQMSLPREHRGHCTSCGGRTTGTSVQVTIVSGCRHMVREYAL